MIWQISKGIMAIVWAALILPKMFNSSSTLAVVGGLMLFVGCIAMLADVLNKLSNWKE